MGCFGAVMGHSRSWAMPPFDRAHRTSYSTLAENHASILYRFRHIAICRKSPILTHPTCIWRPRRGDTGRISRRSLASENYTIWAIVRCYLCDSTFSRFSRTLTCDRETDGQTDRHRAMASTADAWHRVIKIVRVLFRIRKVSAMSDIGKCATKKK